MRRVAPFAALLLAAALLTAAAPAQGQTIFQKRQSTFQTTRPMFQMNRPAFQGPSPGGVLWGNTPWFSNTSIRRELNLTEPQFNQLQQGYQTHFGRYQKDLSGLEQMTPAERFQRQQEITNNFLAEYNNFAGNVLEPPQQTRWQQLETQYRGFADPAALARLNLNDNQVSQLNQLAQQYNTDLANVYATGKTDPAAASRQYQALRQQYQEGLNNILVPQQQRAWFEMTGQPFDIPPEFGTPPKQ
jgi:hypothetical protein